MRVTVSLPKDVYWQAKREATDERQDLDEYIERLVSDAVDVESSDSDSGDEAFEQEVYRWFDLDEGSARASHVAGVARRLRDGYDFAEAVRQRADEYRRDHDVGDTYENTVRAACTRQLGITGEGATKQFINEVEKLVATNER